MYTSKVTYELMHECMVECYLHMTWTWPGPVPLRVAPREITSARSRGRSSRSSWCHAYYCIYHIDCKLHNFYSQYSSQTIPHLSRPSPAPYIPVEMGWQTLLVTCCTCFLAGKSEPRPNPPPRCPCTLHLPRSRSFTLTNRFDLSSLDS